MRKAIIFRTLCQDAVIFRSLLDFLNTHRLAYFFVTEDSEYAEPAIQEQCRKEGIDLRLLRDPSSLESELKSLVTEPLIRAWNGERQQAE
jgi:hypothetical protein